LLNLDTCSAILFFTAILHLTRTVLVKSIRWSCPCA